MPSEGDDATALETLLARANVEPRLVAPLARYGAIVLEAGRRFNLTGAKTPAELLPHLLDGLSLLPYVRAPYVDVGSGAGLPAIPIAIGTGVAPTMIEASAKKAHFLESALDTLGLPGRVVAERAEIAARRHDLRERFASGTARAVGAAPTVAEYLLPLIEPGGVALLQRGRLPERERTAVEDAAIMLGAAIDREVPLEGERRLLILTKQAQTPARFPRRAGIPAKRPLCM